MSADERKTKMEKRTNKSEKTKNIKVASSSSSNIVKILFDEMEMLSLYSSMK